MISETKLADSFPVGQFYIDGFGLPIRLDLNKRVGRIMLYAYERIPIKLLSSEATRSERFYVEMNLYVKKRLMNCSYKPEKGNISKQIPAMKKILDLYSAKYENIIVLGNFNLEVHNKCRNFCKSYNFMSSITRLTCFKNSENSLCMDLALANSSYSFQSGGVIETG